MNFSDICKRLESTKHVALVAHKNPDGDACGSLEGMRCLIEDNFPHISISVVVPAENFDTHVFWVMGQTQTTLPENTDLIIILDTSLYTRTALHSSVFDGIEALCIDHHETFPESIGGYVDATASATALILTEQALAHNWQISPKAATALLLGIYTDTGGFIHRNTDARSFVAAAELMKRGADQIRISAEVFGNYPLEYLHDLGKGLLSIVVEDRVACLFLGEDTNTALKNHIIGFLSGIANVDIACVLIQLGDVIKGSLRTRKADIDVNELAKKFGGGGHKKASGFEIPGSLNSNTLTWNNQQYTPNQFIHVLKKI